MTQTSPPQANKKYVFLDTCVIQYAGDKNKFKSEAVITCLSSLGNDYNLAISEVTLYEHLHGLWGERASRAASLMKTYEKKEVTSEVFILAAVLGGLYHGEKLDGMNMGDKIIAATTILADGFVLTANHKDYPAPFFLTSKEFPLAYKIGHYTSTLDLSLYKPNIPLIRRRIEENDR